MSPSSEEIRERPRTSCLRFATLGLLLPGVLFAVGVTIGIPVAVMVGLGIVGFFGWLAWLVVLKVDWMRQHQRRIIFSCTGRMQQTQQTPQLQQPQLLQASR